MSTPSYTVTLYIDPEQGGPVTPLEIDLMQIENEVLAADPSTDRDELRIDKIVEQIKNKKEFKDVDPSAKRHELRFLIGRLGHIAIFNGIVLSLPGTIEADPPGTSPPDPTSNPTVTVEDYKDLKDLVDKLGQQLAACESKCQAAEFELKKERSIVDPLVEENKKAREEVAVLRTSVSSIKSEVTLLKTEAERYKIKAQRLEAENASLQTQLTQALQERQRFQQSLQDLATLRQDLTNKNNAEKQLRITLEQREKDLKSCREQMRNIASQASKNTSVKDEDPWLDS